MKIVALEKELPGVREKALQPLLKEVARQVLPTLPLVTAGLNEFELIPLVPYDGLACLFA